MRTSLALKIFLSFWLIHAVIFVVLALAPDPGANAMFIDRTRHDGQLAAWFLDREGADACVRFLRAVESRTLSRTALLASGDQPACALGPGLDDVAYERLIADASADGIVRSVGGRRSAAVTIRGPSGLAYKVVATLDPGASSGGRPPAPYGFLVTAIIVSGVVCLLLAGNLAAPLRRMRAATGRLKDGDLSARAGAGFEARRDEIGDVVRDFDAMAERIESLLHAQQQLLSDISHELRSPLARLNVALELARRTSGGAAEAHLARIESEAERMNELIGRLLALSRAESVGSGAQAEEFDLEEVIQRVADDAKYEAHRTGKRVDVSVDGHAILRGDPALIASAIENVVRNAIKYTPPDSTVDVTATVTAGHAQIVVRDHGSGVPDANLARVFLPFYRVDGSRDRESGGTGLGLSIAQRAVASQGGTIRADNAEGGGLQVTITLPMTTH